MTAAEPRWLGRLATDEAHVRQIREHGGAHGVRDENAIEAALARPRQRWAYRPGVDLAELAAAYAYGIISGHPYIDGNKRVALVALAAFLDLNGVELTMSDDEAVDAMLAVAAGTMSEADLAAWIGAHSTGRSGRANSG